MLRLTEDDVFNCLNLYHQHELSQEWTGRVHRSLQLNCNQNDLNQSIEYQNQVKGQVQKLPPTSLNNQDQTISDQFIQFYHPKNHPQDRALIPLRKKMFISVSSLVQSSRQAFIKGKSYQTQNIGKHLKSITIKYLQLLCQARMLHQSQIIALNIFNQSNGSINDFQILLKIKKLCLQCHKFYSSKYFISTVMASHKMDFRSKLMMIKYGQKLRSLTYVKVKGWKMVI